MDARFIVAAALLVAGTGIAVAGTSPQSALTATKAQQADPGQAVLKGTVGTVDAANGTFTLTDGEASILVEHEVPLPAAIEPGNSLVTKGAIVHDAGEALFQADEVQVGCPSQYEA